MAADLPPDVDARLFRPADEDAPPGWETLSARPIVQMTLDRSELLGSQPADVHISPLTVADVAETLELAKLARPGPFAPRVLLLGGFIGIRDAATGRLIAMGGERFRMSGHVELSAIAVHPNARGRGYGAALTGALARAALARGEIPFLHVYPDNPAASIYTRLGFRERRTLWVFVRRRRGRW